MDIDVSVDGTWQRCGFSSLYGVVLAIAAGSGEVVDFTVKSRVCVSCQHHIQLDPNSDEYKCWKQKHIDNGECSKNFDGSAKAIECTGAVEIWRRSVPYIIYDTQLSLAMGIANHTLMSLQTNHMVRV